MQDSDYDQIRRRSIAFALGDDQSLFPGETEVAGFVRWEGLKEFRGSGTIYRRRQSQRGRAQLLLPSHGTQCFTRSDASVLHIYIPGMESHGIPGNTRT